MIKFLTDKIKPFDLELIDGDSSERVHNDRTITIFVEGQIGEVGDTYIDGVKVSKSTFFRGDQDYKLSISAGEVMKEFDKEYVVELKDYKEIDGTLVPDTKFVIRTIKKRVQDPKYKDDDEKALIAARESFVLLKNKDNILPLRKDEVLNIFGDVDSFRITSFGSPKINPRWCPSFVDAIYDYSEFTLNEEIHNIYKEDRNAIVDKETLIKTKDKSDIGIIYITRRSGENIDNRPIKGEYYLSDNERQLIKNVSEVYDKTVLILNCGYPTEMGFIDEYDIDSVIYTGFAGMLASYALVETLDGRNNPSGKLPTTFPYDYFDTPASKNFIVPDENEENPFEKTAAIKTYYLEDIYVGYRYFDSFDKKVAYCFGHGLSYTNFNIELVSFNEDRSLDIKVTNTGTCAGKEVIEVYVKVNQDRYEIVNRSLCAFEKSKLLEPSESQIIHIDIDEFTIANFVNGEYTLVKGQYELYVGNSLNNSKVFTSFDVLEDKTVKKVNHVGLPVEEFKVLSKDNPNIDSLSRKIKYEDRLSIKTRRQEFNPKELEPYAGETIMFDDVKKDESLLNNFISQMDAYELCVLNYNGGNHWHDGEDGCAGALAQIDKYGIKPLEVSDASAGINMVKPNIGFPQPSSIGATFNKDIAYMIGKVIATESVENNIVINLGPGFNIHRNILNGRNAEYYSEDPFLSGTMAGNQGKGLEENGVGATYKHMFANNAETLRKSQESIVSERALREIYLKNFEYAFRTHKPISVMNCYNALNGIYPAESSELMQGFVRDELGFDGIIMTDWFSYSTIDEIEIAKAGSNWISDGDKEHIDKLYKAYEEGKISKAILQHNALHVIKAFIKFYK
ncbi:MAG: glycoside hydrolase family 3 protein [Firmicutes bacterium]|nr:glycoside hydrolase family 3 protein [Candidatus Colivicinus equi]